MSRHHRYRPTGHSYRELIATVQESACDLVEHQMKRDRDRFSYEKQKLVLLILIALSLWIMFFPLWGRLDDFRPGNAVPATEQRSLPTSPESFPQPRYEEPIAIHYA
jgi:hypothetical protein